MDISRSPDGCTLNHFIIDTRHISNVMDIHTYRGAHIDSDHYLVGTKLRAKISNAKKCYGSRQEKFDIQALKDENIIKYYVDKIQTLLSSSAEDDKCWIIG
jgi:hypothetical protein